MKFHLSVLAFFIFSNILFAGNVNEFKCSKAFNHKQVSNDVQFYQVAPIFQGEEFLFDVRDQSLNSKTSLGKIMLFGYNPAGFSVVTSYDNNHKIFIYRSNTKDRIIKKIKLDSNPISISYSSDAKYFVVGCSDNSLRFINTQDYLQYDSKNLNSTPERLVISPNGFYIGVFSGSEVSIYDISNWNLKFSSKATSLSFSDDGTFFAISTYDGHLALYDAHSFSFIQDFSDLGNVIDCCIHQSGKYIAVVNTDNKVIIQNRLNVKQRYYISETLEDINEINFVSSCMGDSFLTINTPLTLYYSNVGSLSPYYGKLVTDELNQRMALWMNQMDGETVEQYNERVNDQTRLSQMKLFEQEISTRLADNLLEISTVSIGGYNLASNVLTILFDQMPSIYLTVPEKDIDSFKNTQDLQFSNAKFCLTAEDKFELVYVEVLNTATGLSYVFDNRQRSSLDFLKMEEEYVPLEIIRQKNMDEIKLNEIKEKVIETATNANIISHHTQINVNTSIENDFNSDGKRIRNYRVAVNYTVDKSFSELEDFAPGKYKYNESGAASSMLGIIKNAFESDFSQYLKSGKQVKITITGTADNTPIVRTIKYDACYGQYTDLPVKSDGKLTAVSLNSAEGISTNIQLAFARAAGLKQFVENEIKELSKMDIDYLFCPEVSEQRGSKYRRISVEFLFVDAF